MDKKINPKAIDNLLTYLPLFRNNSADDLSTFHPPEEKEDGTIVIGSYTYHPKIHDFFDEIYDHWTVQDYLGRVNWDNLKDQEWIETADIQDLKLAFTFLARAEYWATGSWAGALEDGIFTNLLERLKKIN